jgi:hypothetical protein
MRKTLRAFVGAALVFAFTFVSTGVASADSKHGECYGGSNPRCEFWWGASDLFFSVGWAVFTSDGEVLEIQDEAIDGRGIYVKVKYTVGTSTYYDYVYSYTPPSEHREVVNYDIPEGTVVYLHACQTDNGSTFSCVDRSIKA